MTSTTPVQQAARLVGIVFLLVGIAGFIPGITTNLYDGLDFAGDAWVPINDADDWLHLGLAVGLLALGFLLTRDRDTTVATT